jgi:phage/plasmid-associated DNA primase
MKEMIVDDLLHNSITLVEDRIKNLGDAFYKLNDANFVYSNKLWWMFNKKNSRWAIDDQNSSLENSITDLLTRKLYLIFKFYQSEKKSFDNLITQLNKPSFTSKIESYIRDKFQVVDFEKTCLNSNLHLLPFLNGVYDLDKKIFRETEKKDYVELYLNYNYDPLVSTDTVFEFISQIFPSKDMRDYFLLHLSKCLDGNYSNKLLHFFNSNGPNGKTTLWRLISETLGDFMSSTSSIKESLPQSLDARYSYISEYHHNNKFYSGQLKQFLGGETVVTRKLYCNPTTFQSHSKFFIACTQIPSIIGDQTIWEKIRIINLNSNFVDNPDPTKPNEYKKDHSTRQKIVENPIYKQGFIHLLLQYYYKDHNDYTIPKSVIPNNIECKYTSVFAWCNDNIQYSKNSNSIVTIRDIKNCFLNLTNETSFKQSLGHLIRRFFLETYNVEELQYRVNNIRSRGYKGFCLTNIRGHCHKNQDFFL